MWEHLGLECCKSWEVGSLKGEKGTQGTKTQCGIFPHQQGRLLGTCLSSRSILLATKCMHSYLLRDVCSRNEFLRLMLYIEMMVSLSIQWGFLTGAENVSIIYNNGRMIIFLLEYYRLVTSAPNSAQCCLVPKYLDVTIIFSKLILFLCCRKILIY